MAKKRGPGRPRKKKNKKKKKEKLPELEISPKVKRLIFSVIFLLLAVFTLLAVFDAAGAAGALYVKLLDLLFGWVGIVLPLVFLILAATLFSRQNQDSEEQKKGSKRIYIGVIFLMVGLTGLFHIFAMRGQISEAFELVKQGQGGGYFGALSAFPLYSLVDFWGGVVILAALLLISVILLWGGTMLSFAKYLRKSTAEVLKKDEEDGKDDKDTDKERGVKINKMESAGFSSNEVPEDTKKASVKDSKASGDDSEVEVKNYNENDADDADIDAVEIKSSFKKGNWDLPTVGLLEDSKTAVDSGNIEANVKIIKKTLADFGIEVEMGEVNVGPTVTQYTLRPAQGIKLSQIVALQNDLALALAASSIRIEAPIPGRSLVGIEVPNKATAIVRLKDIIASEKFRNNKSNLAFALGRDVAGQAQVTDLSKMPHLLIAGATGAGKSVSINSLLISLLYRNSPEELRFIVIDPKRVELNLYNGVPHLLTPIITDHEKSINALKWAVAEMDKRYEKLAEAGKRNIGEYNSSHSDKIPYIVIVVDELADLMAVAQADVESAVVRLAQMARAVGVHLVLATQRPSVDIITGLIKANITSRIAFAVASQVDSRTILDVSGAEKLLGSGDMLFISSEQSKPKRIQGTYISEKEVKAVVKFLKEQAGEVKYSEEILEKRKMPSSVPGHVDEDESEDELLPEAIEEIRQAGKGSASLLQRRLRVGYARAARLLDMMEERGMVGPAQGSKPREVYLGDEEAEEETESDEEIYDDEYDEEDYE